MVSFSVENINNIFEHLRQILFMIYPKKRVINYWYKNTYLNKVNEISVKNVFIY